MALITPAVGALLLLSKVALYHSLVIHSPLEGLGLFLDLGAYESIYYKHLNTGFYVNKNCHITWVNT